MKRIAWFCLFAVALPALVAAQPESPFPVAPIPVPAPVPPAPPGGVLKLTADSYYVVNSKADAALRVHPAGLVTVTKEVGPLKLRGKFAGGNKVETRTFAGPCVYILEAVSAKTGRVEIDLIPYGFKTDADIYSAALDVDGGTAPIPPPKPVPPKPVPPKPEPPKPPEPVTSFRVILVYESGNQPTPAQRGVLYGVAVENWLNANCTGGKNGWRRRDKDVPGENDATMAALWDAVKPNLTVTPCAAVNVNGKVEIINLEATPAKMIEVFQTYRGK